MRFLITGGAGFIGVSLANRLAREGHEVRALDDLSNGNQQALLPQIFFTRGDVSNIPQLWSLLQDVDCVYHLAAKVSVPQSILYPHDYNEVNVGGTVSLMEAMRDAGVSRVVLASSGAIYGEKRMQPVHEEDMPAPNSPYAVSKWSAEQYVHTIGELWGIETVSLRIFNAYGPGQSLPVSHAPVVPRFLRQALLGGSLVLYGSGQQTRDFIYISDVIQALIFAATARDISRLNINIGSGIETSIATLVQTIENVLQIPLNIIRNPEKSGGANRLVADIGRARQMLGFRPQVDLESGLRATLENDPRFNFQQSVAVPA